MKIPHFLELLAQDVRYGFRQWRRSPGLVAVIVLSLALGIGANTALFSVVNATLLRGVAVEDPDTLVAFGWQDANKDVPDAVMNTQSGRSAYDGAGRPMMLSFPYPSFTHIRSHARSFSNVVGFVPLGMFNRASAVVQGEPMFVDGEMVTENYFSTFGVRAARGRCISAADENPTAPRVAVISDAFWNRVFGRDPSALGATITLSREPVTIVGIAPKTFTGLETGRSTDIWIPITMQGALTPWSVKPGELSPEVAFVQPNYWWLQVVGRLKPGVTEEQARSEIDRLLRASFAPVVSDSALATLPHIAFAPAASGLNLLRSRIAGRGFLLGGGQPLAVLATVVGIVLLVACVNVATLLLARATTRRKEMSVRLAMGASRWRLLRQLLTEHALYAAAGTAVGLVAAAAGGQALLALLTAGPNPVPVSVGLDWSVLGFTALVSIVATIAFGFVPAVRATRVEAAADLKDAATGSLHDLRLGRFRLGRIFVAVQIAMTVPLVLGAGLFLRTIMNLENQQLGFDSEKLLLFSVDGTKAGYKDAALLRAYEDLREAVGAVPGVKAATFSRLSLVSGWTNNGRITVEGEPADSRKPTAHWNAVGPGFFGTMGMRLVLGRVLTGQDTEGSLKVAVINETMARTFFGNGSPIGRRFSPGRGTAARDPITVVGVLKDAKYSSMRSPAPPTYFIPASQARYPTTNMAFEVRTAGDPGAIVGQVREIARRIVPGVPLGDVKTQAAQIDESLALERTTARLFTFFGLTTLLLACIGLHGTMAYTLRRRTREIGIRMALGAGKRSVLKTAMAETLVMAIAGIVVGAGLAAAGARFVRSLMFGVTPLDPTTIVCGVGLMLTVAIVAGYVPARRAARIDPMRALRDE